VLLPASVLLRRADSVDVIGAGLLAAASGLGHRRVAGVVDRPASTVRGWLRRTARVAARVLAVCAAAAWFGTDFTAPAPAPSAAVPSAGTSGVAVVVEMVGALGRAAGRRLGGSRSPWRLAAVVTGGLLLTPDGPTVTAPRPDRVVAVADPGNTSSLLAPG
jgi:hypothetical protein